MTHYATLGINETATQEEIKRAYRKLAMQHHPDKGGDTAKFQQIQTAYDAINDDQKRAQYDAERSGQGGIRFNINGQPFGGGAMPPEMEDMLRNFGFGFAGGDPLGQFRQSRRNKDLQVDLVVPLVSTLDTQTKTISVQTTNNERVTVEVQIPRGVSPNSTIKYPGLGDNLFESLPRGDLYVRIHVTGQPDFAVNGLDLVKKIDIDCINAIIGHELVIDGLDAKRFSIAIPAGTQPGSKFRIPHQGLYAMNQNHRGSLIVIANIIIPTVTDPTQVQLLKTIQNTINPL
jgi:DnaJ-class molecular chaperone